MQVIYYSNARSRELEKVLETRNGSWMHIVAPGQHELEQLSEKFKLDIDLLTDAVDLYEAPRVERDGTNVYIYTRYYHADNGVINATEPLLIIYRPEMVITIQRVNSAILNRLIDGREQVITTQKTKTLLQILDEVNASYRTYVNKATRNILSARSQLKRTDISNEVLLGFVGMEDDLNEFLSALQPQGSMLRNLLNGKYIKLYEEDKDLIEDLQLNTTELIELVKSRLKTIITIREAYDAIATSELNRTFRRLTSISIFLMIPTIVSGLYGMNVDLPFDHHKWAFYYVIFFVIVVSSMLVYIFRKRRWF